jgi:hypothetical protein
VTRSSPVLESRPLSRAALARMTGTREKLLSAERVATVDRLDRRVDIYELVCADEGTGDIRRARVVAKFQDEVMGRSAHAVQSELRNTGFRPPAPLRVTESFGYFDEHRVSLQAAAVEPPWIAALHFGENALRAVSSGAAAWLLKLQDGGVTGPRRSARTELLNLREAVSVVDKETPRLRTMLRSEISGLTAELGGRIDTEVPSHGDYHPKNVLSDGSTVTVIDFDRFGLREAAYDPGEAIAQLLIMSVFNGEPLARGVQSAEMFWSCYSRAGAASPRRVVVHMFRSVIQVLGYKLLLGSPLPGIDRWIEFIGVGLSAESPEEALGFAEPALAE